MTAATLSTLRIFLRKTRAASLKQIAKHFSEDPEALLPMLQYWQCRNCVEKRMKTPACMKSCSFCDPLDTQWFVWTD